MDKVLRKGNNAVGGVGCSEQEHEGEKAFVLYKKLHVFLLSLTLIIVCIHSYIPKVRH
jgi:hypothetical protein